MRRIDRVDTIDGTRGIAAQVNHLGPSADREDDEEQPAGPRLGMSKAQRRHFVLEPIADDPEVGRWLAALEDGRRDTLRELETVRPEMLDWRRDAPLNSIGTLLYHVALVEASWLLEDIFEGDSGPDWLTSLLPFEDRDGTGRLIRVDGETMAEHLERLAAIRAYLLDRLRSMTADDFHRPRRLADYDAAPDWAIHHLLQHEAEHRSHIAWLRDTYPS